jgi:CRISPR/Cas system-associated exonuclease Cas4 (RecB family)
MIVQPALQAHAAQQIKNFLKSRRHTQSHYVGASEIGLCLRRTKFTKVSKQIIIDGSAEGWGASQRGKTFEDHFWVPAMRKRYGKNLLYSGKQQHSLVRGDLRATPDGLLINQKRNALQDLHVDDIGPSGEIVLDCKTIDPRINLSTPKPEHEFQSQIQLALLRLTTKHRPDYAVISYVNASFYDDVVEFAIRYDASVYETAKKRAALIKKAKVPDALPPEGWIAGGKECEYCPFATACQEMRGDVPSVSKADNLDKGLLVKIVELAREEKRWDAKASASEEEQRKMQHQIKELLKAHGLNRITHDGIVVVWSPVKGRISFDMPALRAAAAKLGLDIQHFETVGQPTDRLVITEKTN